MVAENHLLLAPSALLLALALALVLVCILLL
jgi:hypothetical protein